MISSEMPELLGMSDRIMVMCEGGNRLPDSGEADSVQVMNYGDKIHAVGLRGKRGITYMQKKGKVVARNKYGATFIIIGAAAVVPGFILYYISGSRRIL